jgi:hypothetical protein
MVLLSEDRLYAATTDILYVYSMRDLISPITTISLERIYSGIIIDDRLYLGGIKNLLIFKVTTSLNQPLESVKNISTKKGVLKILRVGSELLLGELDGYFEVFEIKTSCITHTR